MSSIHTMTHMALVLILVVALPLLLAAVPPMSNDELTRRADLIVVGRITRVSTEIAAKGEEYEDTIFRIELAVTKCEKGDVARGTSVIVTTWKPSKRPHGWTGPQGQNDTPISGAEVRCFARGDASKGHELITPNGLQVLTPAPATKPS